jgi:hypothetical protein
MRNRKTAAAWKWIIPSVLLHAALVLLPIAVFETFFPTGAPERGGPPGDPTPDFEKHSIHLVYMQDEEPRNDVTHGMDRLAEEETARILVHGGDSALSRESHRVPVQPASAGAGNPDWTAGGGEDGPVAAEEPRFYPPVPRLIVPPSVEKLDIAGLTVTLRIHVDKKGRPLEIVMLNAPQDDVVYQRVMEAASAFRFHPARLGDDPVEAWIDLPLDLRTTRRD